ncbi:protein NO VEIN domain-containing protein [Ralstonia chuxiongensis]|uniref:protein NO VEIN domain-containing protein n=1 Tax=Ralstonia chuxiongensis TaxID=2957504 RepID=UPI00292F07B1|nr:DUF3883 domain-containing protein [Ralstonia chuxiongensis]
MERYDGPDTITGGGAYVAANGVGGEVFNFKPSRGKCYGYAMSLHFSGINLRFLDDSRTWSRGDELSGVDVVFIAKRPGVGQVVVGWYRNATVFHREYRVRRGTIQGMSEGQRYFLCVADVADVHLLAEELRTFVVPAAPAGHKGFPGQSNVWYPMRQTHQPAVLAFAKRLRKYISTATAMPPQQDELEAPARRKGGRKRAKPDRAHNVAVEAAAIDAALAYYEDKGYVVETVETENLGWDLEATKGQALLLIEVKGVSVPTIYFELTPNEYRRLQEYAPQFRVCIVCSALDEPRLFELAPARRKNDWCLRSKSGDVLVQLKERIAAVGVEVAQE